MKVAIYTISGLYAGIAGVGLAARIGSGYTLAGQGFELDFDRRRRARRHIFGRRPRQRARNHRQRAVSDHPQQRTKSRGNQPLRSTGGKGSGGGGSGRAVHAGTAGMIGGLSIRRRPLRLAKKPRGCWTGWVFGPRSRCWLSWPPRLVRISFRLNNFLNILNQSSVVGVTAVGVTLVMITGGVDLSVGSVISLSADICATVMNGNDARIVLAIALSVGAGAAVGFVNGCASRQAQPAKLYPNTWHRGGGPGPRPALHWRDGERRRRSVVPEHDRRPTVGTYSGGGARLPCGGRCWTADPGDQRAREPTLSCRQQHPSRLSKRNRRRSGADLGLYTERRDRRYRRCRLARRASA